MLAIAGIMPSYWLLKWHAKKNALQHIAIMHKDALISVSASQINKGAWENEQEFNYQDVQYDIVSMTVKGADTMYYCYADEAESSLNYKLKIAVEEQLQHNIPLKNKTKQLICQLQELFFSDSRPIKLPVRIFRQSLSFQNASIAIKDCFLKAMDRPPIV